MGAELVLPPRHVLAGRWQGRERCGRVLVGLGMLLGPVLQGRVSGQDAAPASPSWELFLPR